MKSKGVSGYRILVVDDCPDTVEVICTLLGMLGHEPHGATSGLEAIDKVQRLDPAIVVMDLSMPGLDGYAVARRLRAHHGARPYLVALTGWGRPEDLLAATQAGFDELLVKPPDPDELRRVLDAAPIQRPLASSVRNARPPLPPAVSALRIKAS